MVGSYFVRHFLHPEQLLLPDRADLDLTDSNSVNAYFSNHPDIDAVIHFAAYTNASASQKQKGDSSSPCYQLNVVATSHLVNQIKDRDIHLIHISTDMVYPGDSADPGPYTEDHQICLDQDRLSWYGYTKALAEKIILDNLPSAAIFRLIHLVSNHQTNRDDYLRVPLAYYETNRALYPIFTDQTVNISDADEVCLGINRILERRLSGTFHAGSADITTPYKMLIQLFDLVCGHHSMVKPGKISQYLSGINDSTRYPKLSGLLNSQTQSILGLSYSISTQIIKKIYG